MFGHRFNLFYAPDGDGGGASGGSVGGDSGQGSSTSAIVETSVASAQADGSIEPAADAVATAPPAPDQTPEEKAEEAEVARIQAELKAKNPKLQGKIDVDRHQAVLTRARNQAKAEYEAAVAKHNEQMKEFEWAKDPEAKAAIDALALADSDPKRFIELLRHDARYKDLIDFKEAQAAAANQDPAPEPDQVTPDGSMRYFSHEGLTARMEWERRQAIKESEKLMEAKYGPVLQEHEARNKWNESVGNASKYVGQARESWPGFKESEQPIGAYMVANPKASMEDAYREVVVKKFQNERQVNETELRKKLMAEMNRKPVAASSEKPGMGAERASEAEGGKSTESVVRAALREQGLV